MKKNITMVNNTNKEIKERELESGYITYRTLADRVGNMILCNNMANRYGITMEIENGCDYDEETEEYAEIFQWYIISGYGAEYLMEVTDELVFYDSELDVYVWGITHWGTSWDYVFTDVKATENIEDILD